MHILLAAVLVTQVTANAQGWGAIHGDPVPPEMDVAYVRGLQFLARTQSPEGFWPGEGETGPGVVGLAVLAMLARGDDPEAGPWAVNIRRGLEFILRQQRSDNGYIGPSMYHHGFATLALAEAYGAVDDPRLGPALKRAADLILASQALNPTGGWRYSPDARDADTTVSGAQIVALLAVRNAGIAVPDAAIWRALQFYEQCQTSDGQIGYTGNDGGGSGARNAIAVTVALLARERSSPLFRRTFEVLRTRGDQDGGGYFFYYLYYAAQAFFHADPAAWREWNAKNIRRLLDTQGADGSWSGPHGRVFCTSAALLSLAVNYRYLPIYER
ncbi:MAG: terpene cyclase/mutase family protein [Kiritimatiellae bacterium]|nr:terpene cyclase/mutase family protein [Kiritimatiellia bacterium]